MKTIITFLLIASSCLIQAQNKKIEKYIALLSNNEFIIDHNTKAKFSVESKAAKKLIRIGTSANAKLIEALSDPERNIMAHWTLCQINFHVITFAGPKSALKGDEDVNLYFLGEEKNEGVTIIESKTNGHYKKQLDKQQIDKITAYWKNKAMSK